MHFACVSLNATELKDHAVFYSGCVNDGRSFRKTVMNIFIVAMKVLIFAISKYCELIHT